MELENETSSPKILTRTCFTNIQKNPKYDTFLDVNIVWDFETCQIVEDIKRSLHCINIHDYQILLNKGTYYEHLKTHIQIKIKHMTDRDKFIPYIPTKRWVDYLDEDDDEDESQIRIDMKNLQTISIRDISRRSCFIQTCYGEIHRHNKSDNFLDFILYDTNSPLYFYTVLKDIEYVLHKNDIHDYQILINMGEYVTSYKTLIQMKLKRTDDIRKIKLRGGTRVHRESLEDTRKSIVPAKKTWATVVVQEGSVQHSTSPPHLEYVPPHKRSHSSSTT